MDGGKSCMSGIFMQCIVAASFQRPGNSGAFFGGRNEVTNQMNRRVAQALLVLGGGVVAAFLSLGGAGAANADVHILDGGNTDCTSQGFLATKQSQSDYNPNDTYIPVAYGDCSGDFAPFLGGMRAPDAIAQGTANTQAVWDANCSAGQRCTLEGFSLGDAPVTNVGNNVGADALGVNPNTHVITNGNGWGETGFLSDSSNPVDVAERGAANAATGVLVDVPQVPGSENRNFTNDIWGNGGDQPPWAQITQVSTINGDPNTGLPQHAAPDVGQPHNTFTTDDGVTQEMFPGQGTYPGVVDPSTIPGGEVPDGDAVLPPPAG
jgi:hypothetical protein